MVPKCVFSGVGLLPASEPSVWGTSKPNTTCGRVAGDCYILLHSVGIPAGNTICRPVDDRGWYPMKKRVTKVSQPSSRIYSGERPSEDNGRVKLSSTTVLIHMMHI